ncbi:ribose-5-phosphate isomerase [Spirilliplanes yamanashiensis]|uniref:D-erythrulose 4-phosphate isomerase n=1 Tax=Spirilliplanes yamanashiensis TaxID=42233 RepID=A0A8J3YAM4_9ACTN|nr:ribose-5-phosphate isomerase [Spirilliplanes yamanashiensis]MDP9817609.1 ribose 5-phosphate isomerase B [Spirilliplanes yamanashiensis]GIJ04419.1 D-erythrulose-4-phosphate isomerase [Spirilliplanes yamanashiensis]
MTLRIVVGADEAGLALKDSLAELLRADDRVSVVDDVGVHDAADHTAYPNVALDAAQAVAAGRADRALLVCGTGIGMAVAANKVTGVRATVAHDSYSVERSVLSNNCQVLALGARVVGPELAKHLVHEWLGLTFDESSASAEKVEVISRYEAADT